MTTRRTAYELSASQVATPRAVVTLFWRLVMERRSRVGSVLDMGAGDGRFAEGGSYDRYTGVELDARRAARAARPRNGRILRGCAFRHRGGPYDACVGNPPYARHHDIESSWKDRTVERLNRELGVSLDKHCNLYLYFLCLGLIKTRDDGLVALVIPYEWVSRPSANAVRDLIRQSAWNVDVYRFRMPIFGDVVTTASISIVDKARKSSEWRYHEVLPSYEIATRASMTESALGVLPYAKRGAIWALRGLSPGSQTVFTLTEGERVRAGLTRHDVRPCVTTLRGLPRSLRQLSRAVFEKRFVRGGRRCWLIKSHAKKRSSRLNAYLAAVPAKERRTHTCVHQRPWFNYHTHPVPQILFGSGFASAGPKVLLNSVRATAVGSVWGIHAQEELPLRRLRAELLRTDFEGRVVPHAKTLRKVEVGQLNGVLNAFHCRETRNGRRRPR